jgi:hypothetical protein
VHKSKTYLLLTSDLKGPFTKTNVRSNLGRSYLRKRIQYSLRKALSFCLPDQGVQRAHLT